MARLHKALAAAAVTMALPVSALGQEATMEPEPADGGTAYLAVISGTSGSMDAETLTLEGVDGVLVFTDRPDREAFVIPLRDAEASASMFDGDPPNAVLSVLAGEAIANTVVELADVVDIGDSSLTLSYLLIEGEPPQGAFGPASLFVDGAAPVIVDALCETVQADPADEPPQVVEFCSQRSGG